jgi:hypothetical protein
MSSVKRRIVFAMMLILAPLWAKDDKDAHLVNYPEKAHVLSAVKTQSRRDWTLGVTLSLRTEIQIGSLIYLTRGICKHAEVGHDYPAKVDEKDIRLLAGDQQCSYRILSKREK